MTSEIRANTLKNRVGLGTVSFTNTGPVVSGIVTANTIRLADDNKIQLGNSSDLEIYHQSNVSYIDDTTGNQLRIQANDLRIRKQDGGEEMITAVAGGTVRLYFDGSQKFTTSNTGATVTGTLVATTFDGNLTGNVTGNISGGTVGGSTGTFSGDVSITDKIVHTDDTNTAIRFPSDDTISFETGGSERFRITSDGKVGINEQSPQSLLDIHDGTAANDTPEIRIESFRPTIRFADRSSSQADSEICGDNGIKFRVSAESDNDTALTERLRIDSTGALRVNTTRTTATKLHVVGGTASGTAYDAAVFAGGQNSTSGSGVKLYLSGCENDPTSRGVILESIMTDNSNAHRFSVKVGGSSAAPTERFRLPSDGRAYFFGNQSSTPNGIFGFRYDKNNDTDLSIENLNNSSVNNNAGIRLASNHGNIKLRYFNNGGFYVQNSSASGYLHYFTNNVSRFYIDSSGNVNINNQGTIASSNGNVGKKLGIKSTANNVIIGETTATSEHTGFILEARQTGRSGNARIAQIAMSNDAGADGRIKFHTAPDGADVQERFRISNNGIRSYATFVDTSYHANPDPFGDGSGIVYYRLNDNFHDSGIFAQHGTSRQGGDPTFAFQNSSGERCWNNPGDGAINIPNLKNSYPFTMAAWVNISSWPTSSNNDLIMNLSIGGQRVSLCIVKWGDRSTSDWSIMYGGANHHVFPASSRPTNEWIHVVYSVVGSNDTSHAVYQNGSALSDINKGPAHGGSAGWAIGGNAVNSERFSMGRIGSIRFFNKAISSSEASALYTNDKFYT